MGKTLKVCLAMGGGVSLGSFSGSALTEALKLLVLYGKDSNGNSYDRVVVDGMSGASAGAIALTILLRCLTDYKSMLSLLEGTTEESLLKDLAIEYFEGAIDKLHSHPSKNKLLALQVAQKIQYKVWVEEVDAPKLYGKKIAKNYTANPNKSFALLDRGHLENLAKKYLVDVPKANTSNLELLDSNRVIFVCSLTNLLPIQIDHANYKSNKLEKNVLKSTSSDNHSELRVIDFVFNSSKTIKTDDRWLRFCSKPDVNDSTNFNITSKEAWSTIAASALACGAFPIAFEPVLLKRFQKEFGGDRKGTSWPRSFIEIHKEIDNYQKKNPEKVVIENSFFGEDKKDKLDYRSFNFPYIDGGTFNNEPIREAFKIGTFQDFGTDKKNEERLILFVDPIVRKEHYRSFKVSSFSPVKTLDNRTTFKTEIDKLLGNVSSILSVLIDQGSIKEEHKIIDTRENFQLRKTIFDYLDTNLNMGKNLTVEIISTAFNKVTRNLKKHVISVGTRDPIIYFLEEIRKTCSGQNISKVLCVDIEYKNLYELKKGIDSGKIIEIKEVYSILGLKTHEDQNAFAQAIFKVVTDFSLNTEGKSAKSYRAAIMPLNANYNTIELPGSEIEAFAGFASYKARKYSFEFAKLSTLLSLEKIDGFRKQKNEEGKYIGKPFIKDKKLNLLKENLYNKIDSINFFSEKSTYANELKNHLFAPSIQRIKGLLMKNKLIRFVLLKVPFAATALFGTIAMPVASVVSIWRSIFRKSPWKGSSIIEQLLEKASSQVNFIGLEPVTLSFLSDTKLNKNLYVKCKDDEKPKKLKVNEYPYHSTHNRKRYQYFFKVCLLEYIKDQEVVPDDVSTTLEAFKVDSDLVKNIQLTLFHKVTIPSNIDGNLFPKKKRMAIQQNFERIIESLKIDKYELPSITKAINNKQSLLHYSFKSINFHVNPVIEIDLQDLKKGWYFKEQTVSLDKAILN